MKHERPILYTALFATVLGCFANDSAAATLFSTVRDAPFYLVENDNMSERTKVPAETLVVGTHQTQYQNQLYHYVRFLASNRQPGWICNTDLREFKAIVKEEMNLSDRLLDSADKESLPLVIRQQRSAKLNQAWLSIQMIIRDNESLPEEKRVPEPYFARAEIWAAVDNYPEAMKDYITALHYASSTARELKTYARYHSKVENTINRFTLLPAPPAGAAGDADRRGPMHFAFGVTAFRGRRQAEAVRHFGNAISVEPDNPTYWYYRSVASKRLGDPKQALYDAVYGAFVERHLKAPHKRHSIAHALTHIQGRDRLWLEMFRLGDPSSYIIRSVFE